MELVPRLLALGVTEADIFAILDTKPATQQQHQQQSVSAAGGAERRSFGAAQTPQRTTRVATGAAAAAAAAAKHGSAQVSSRRHAQCNGVCDDFETYTQGMS